jgi:hypothetical protein
MDEPIISKFYAPYYFKAICGAIIFFMLTVYMICLILSGNLEHPGNAYILAMIFIACLSIYFYFFSKSWKRITVTPTEIIVYDVVLKKQLTVAYSDIIKIDTYRTRSSDRGSSFSQDFVIELSGDRLVTINEAWYDNYNRLTMAIYKNKYGLGQGRDRYLARR